MPIRILRLLAPTLLALALTQPVVAQDAKSVAAPEIVVTGQQEAKDIAKFTRNPRVPGGFQMEASNDLNQAQTFIACAKPDRETLRTILEGPPFAAETIGVQGTFVEHHLDCHLHYPRSAFTGSSGFGPSVMPKEFDTNVDVQSLGRSYQAIFDRGAMLDYAIKTYAPDISLTRDETHDDAVIQRFNEKERTRNRYRWPEDLQYFKVAICMVQDQPDLAVRMIRTPTGSAESRKIGASMLSRGRACVPGASRIQVDFTQFRIYVSDALYRWVEAARNVDSLIPNGGIGNFVRPHTITSPHRTGFLR